MSSIMTTSANNNNARINKKRKRVSSSVNLFEEIKEENNKKIFLENKNKNIYLKVTNNNEIEEKEISDNEEAKIFKNMECEAEALKMPWGIVQNEDSLNKLKKNILIGNNLFNQSWNVEWSGTFPINKITRENITKRLNYLNKQQLLLINKRMSGTQIFLNIYFNKENEGIVNITDNKIIFLTHQINKICCFIGRVETKQFAYITKEYYLNNNNKINYYKKQCHIFKTKNNIQIEEIEFIFNLLFQKNKNNNYFKLFNSQNSPKNKLINTSTEKQQNNNNNIFINSEINNIKSEELIKINNIKSEELINSIPMKNSIKRDKISSIGFIERSRSQILTISSSPLIQKIFGNNNTPKKKQKQQFNNNNIFEEKRKQSKKQFLLATPTPSPSLNNGEISSSNFQKPQFWPQLTPLLHSVNSSSTKCSPLIIKQNNNYLISSEEEEHSFCYNFPSISNNNKNNLFYNNNNNGYNNNNIYYYPINYYNNNKRQQEKPELVYDERLKEWIYPLGECMRDELERLAYFCRPNEKDYVVNQLCLMPSGHFMLRLSGSRRRCLALTMRVPENINGTINRRKGIANYLIIRNVHGFRIRGFKRYFQSLPMLITHHSVLPEQLPCRLQLSDWRWTREPKTTTLLRRQSSGGSTAIAMRLRDEERGRQSPSDSSTLMVRWRKPLAQSINSDENNKNINDFIKQQKTSIRTNSINTMFSSKSSTLLSA